MFRFLRRHRTILFVSLALCIVGMLFFGIGANAMRSSAFDTIAKINGTKISQLQFDRVFNSMQRQHSDLTPQQRFQLTGQAFNELIRQEAFDQEAKKYGIRVPDQELQLILANTPAFQKDGKFSPQAYYETLRQVVGMPPNEFEAFRKKDIAASKLNQLISGSIHIPDNEFNQVYQERLKTESDKKKLKEMKDNPESVRDEMRNNELNLVFKDWLTQLNSGLKVSIVSEPFKKRLMSPPPAEAAPAAPPAALPVKP